ncbi:MAG: hypothetical protein AAGA91_04665 [Pseudomonadota bacterium]
MGSWVAMLIAMSTVAEEPPVTLQSTVSGSDEQPRVMYIVPWQQPGDYQGKYRMQAGIADDLFAPIDREEVLRELVYTGTPITAGNNAEQIETRP